MEQMLERFRSLTTREQLILAGGGLLVIVMLAWALIWEPIHADHKAAMQRAEGNERLLGWMVQAQAEARELGAGKLPQANAGGSLLAAIDRSLRRERLNREARRIEPEGSERARVWMDEAAFDRMVRWLGRLQSEAGAQVEEIRIDAGEQPGRVNARITLGRAG